jgi:hypothetical protein
VSVHHESRVCSCGRGFGEVLATSRSESAVLFGGMEKEIRMWIKLLKQRPKQRRSNKRPAIKKKALIVEAARVEAARVDSARVDAVRVEADGGGSATEETEGEDAMDEAAGGEEATLDPVK